MAWSHPHARILARASDNPSAHAAARATGLTGSDFATLWGHHAHDGALIIWARKTDRPVDERPHLITRKWRTAVEPIIAEAWVEHTGLAIRRAGTLGSKAHPIAIQPHAILTEDGGVLIVRQEHDLDGWEDDETPEPVLIRAHWAMVATGRAPAHIACLIGGAHLEIRRIAPDARSRKELVEDAEAWWREHIEDDTPPAPMPRPGDTAATRSLWPRVIEDSVAVDGDTLTELVLDMLTASDELAAASHALDHAKAAIIAHAGDAAVITGPDDKPWLSIRASAPPSVSKLETLYPELAPIYTDVIERRVVDIDALTRDHPDAAAVVRSRVVRVLAHAKRALAQGVT